eukprot:2093071-Rhodomonas_salina.2
MPGTQVALCTPYGTRVPGTNVAYGATSANGISNAGLRALVEQVPVLSVQSCYAAAMPCPVPTQIMPVLD